MVDVNDCKYVHHFNTSEAQCNFVLNCSNCLEASGYLNYVVLLYCNFPEQQILGLCLFGLWLAFLFVGLAVSADDFFCPNLDTISKTLRLSHNIAGITIMALGNGAPDVFSSFASVSQSRPELLLGELFGAGVFVTTFVAGAICVTKPFKLMERPFLRDVVFYIVAGYWAFYIFYRGEIRLFDAIGFLLLYVAYLLVVVIGRFVHQNQRRRALAEALLYQEEEEPVEPTFNVFVAPPQTPITPPSESTTEEFEADDEPITVQQLEVNLDNIHTEVVIQEPGPNPWRQLWLLLVPDKLCSRETKWYSRIWEIIKLPYIFLFTITIPIATIDDSDDPPSNNWSQYLHFIQCIAAPQFVAFAIGYGLLELIFDPGDEFHSWEIVLVGGLVTAIVLLCTTHPTNPPRWRPLFSFIGFLVAVVWIYALANEVVALLKVFGVALGFSDAILGLTLLAWGNSISDLIADVAVARRGFPRMGFSACFGGPLFNLLLGIGLPFCYRFFKYGSAPVHVQYNEMVTVLSASLAVALVSSFLIMPLNKFHGSKWYGIYLIILYIVLLSAALAVEILYGGIANFSLQKSLHVYL